VSFNNLLNDVMTLTKQDGHRIPGIKASVQKDKIFVADGSISISDGDVFERALPSGEMEHYVVIDTGYFAGSRSSPGHYECVVKKETKIDPPLPRKHYAFLSYQTTDNSIAGRLKHLLAEVDVDSFLAHEDITLSAEWRQMVLEEIGKTDLFICLLSKGYLTSTWCVQESGIAAWRPGMTAIPLSIDGTTSPGFLSHIQSIKIDPISVTVRELIPGFLKHQLNFGIDVMIKLIGRSTSFREAEANFELILPYPDKMTNTQAKELLECSAANRQIYQASLCAENYLPRVLKRYGHLLDAKHLQFLNEACGEIADDVGQD